MDAAYFGLTREPFERNPDIDEACLPSSRAELVHELLAEDRGAGAISVVVGDPGVGKSALASILAATIGREREVALVSAASPGLEWIVAEILDQLSAHVAPRDRVRPTVEALREPGGTDRVIIVDDAHGLDHDSLEELVRAHPGHLILLGRASLLEGLGRLAERGAIHAHRVVPLTREEALEYLADRVAAAGGRVDTLFSAGAQDRLVDGTHGLTTLLESIAAQCLRGAMDERRPQVSVEIVDRVLEHAESPSAPLPGAPDPAPWEDWSPPAPAPPRIDPPSYGEAAVPPPGLPPGPEPESRPEAALPPSRRSRRDFLWLGGTIVTVVALAAAWFALSQHSAGPGTSSTSADPPPIHEPIAKGDTVAVRPPGDAVEPGAGTITPIHGPGTTTATGQAPAPTPGAAGSSPQWVVQVGVFQIDRNAGKALRELRALDPGARIEARSGLQFVVSGPVDSEREAADLERRLKAAGLPTHIRPWNSR